MLHLITVLVLAAGADPGWERVGDDEGVTVWARDVRGSRVREMKAETVVAASAERVLAVLEDVARYPEFMPFIEEARVVGTFERGRYEYQRVDPPFGSSRDFTVEVVVSTGADGVVERSWTQANDKGPPQRDGTVRVEVHSGSWTLHPLEDGKTRVTYRVRSDPGGSIPGWMANKGNRKSVAEVLRAVKRRSQDPEWKRG